jgi:hypothetical protein
MKAGFSNFSRTRLLAETPTLLATGPFLPGPIFCKDNQSAYSLFKTKMCPFNRVPLSVRNTFASMLASRKPVAAATIFM